MSTGRSLKNRVNRFFDLAPSQLSDDFTNWPKCGRIEHTKFCCKRRDKKDFSLTGEAGLTN